MEIMEEHKKEADSTIEHYQKELQKQTDETERLQKELTRVYE